MGSSDLVGMQSSLEESKISPYFMEGSAGYLAVLIRYAFVTQDPVLKKLTDSIAKRLRITNCMSATYYYGFSGIGNVLLDYSFFFAKKEYYNYALEVAYKCSLFCNRTSVTGESILFPDTFNMKYSADFGYGSAGIMLFLNRLYNKEKNCFGFFMDEMIFATERD